MVVSWRYNGDSNRSAKFEVFARLRRMKKDT